MQRFQEAVEAGDLDAVERLLAEDVTFVSPVAFRPYRGKAITAAILRGVWRVWRTLRSGRPRRSPRVTPQIRAARRLAKSMIPVLVDGDEAVGVGLGSCRGDEVGLLHRRCVSQLHGRGLRGVGHRSLRSGSWAPAEAYRQIVAAIARLSDSARP